MSPMWDDVAARARGLGTRLLSRQQLEGLAPLTAMPELAAAFARFGLPPVGDAATATASDLELAIRRWGAGTLRILARWAGPRVATLAIIYEDEDRRSLRALVRGALRSAPADARLFGLVPTPSLPERALEELARQAGLAAIAGLLVAWRNPYGAVLAPAAASPEADAFALDIALDRTFVTRAAAAARRGGPALLEFVRHTVDLDNVVTALVLAGAETDLLPRQVFLPGGDRVTPALFEQAVRSREPATAARLLAEALPPGAGAVVRSAGRDFASLEDELLRVRIRDLARHARRDPLGPLPVLHFALRLRAQVIDLQRLVWGRALAAPAPDLARALVSAP